jgi:Flp pilus assembly protein TadD
LYYGRQYDQAIERSRRALELDPHYFRVHRDLGRSYLQKGLYDEAISEFLQAKKLTEDNPVILAMLGHAYAVSGKKEEAAKLLEELQELSKRKYVSSYDVAMIYVGLGDNDQAFERLEQAYKEQAAWLIYLTVDPRLDSLRADPRFVALVERVGLAAF